MLFTYYLVPTLDGLTVLRDNAHFMIGTIMFYTLKGSEGFYYRQILHSEGERNSGVKNTRNAMLYVFACNSLVLFIENRQTRIGVRKIYNFQYATRFISI